MDDYQFAEVRPALIKNDESGFAVWMSQYPDCDYRKITTTHSLSFAIAYAEKHALHITVLSRAVAIYNAGLSA